MKDEHKVAVYVIAFVVSLYAVQALLTPLSSNLPHSLLVDRAPTYAVLTILVLLLLRVIYQRRKHRELLQSERDKTRICVTERKRAVDAQMASEDKFRTMLESSPEAITATDLNGIITDCNEATVRLHGGSSKGEIVGRSVLDFIVPEEHERALENIKRTLEEGIIRNVVYTLLAKGNRRFEGELSSSVIRNQAGEPVSFIAVTKDITERKCAEEALAQSEYSLKKAQEIAHVGSWEWNIRDGSFRLSEEMCRIYGIPGSGEFDSVQSLIRTSIHPDDREAILGAMKTVADGGNGDPLEYRILRPDGEVRLIYATHPEVRRFGHDGESEVMMGTVQDVTEARAAEAAMEESRRRFETIFESTADGILIAEHETQMFFMANKRMAQMLGYSSEEIQNVAVTDIHPAESLAWVREQFEKQVRGEITLAKDCPVKRKDGSVFYADINSVPIDLDGRTFLMGVFRDVTERMLAQEEKEKMQAQLLQAQKMEAVGALAGGVAHDFNNLLATILGYSDLAMRKLDEQDAVYDDIKQIADAGSSAADLTRQLLLFSRQQPIKASILDLNDIVGNMIRMLERLIGEDVRISAALEPDLGPISGDRGNLEQVIMNLALNARDAMPDGGEITITTDNVLLTEDQCAVRKDMEPGRYVRMSVSDNGTGMDEATAQRIFEPFFTTKEAGRGTGLGLSVVYGIVKQHGGRIDVSSRPGEGTTFNVYLKSLPAESRPESPETITHADYRGSGERILIVEDDDQLRGLAGRMLSEHGYRVIDAANAEDAVDTFVKEGEDLDLVFSDVVLPDMTGLQLVDRLLGIRSDLRVLLSSGYADDKAQRSVISERGFRFLPKPHTLVDLLRAVKVALESSPIETSAEKELQLTP
ncbi:MAG: PAS domain S-box protein [Candidatus Eisenbacteria bacterium]